MSDYDFEPAVLGIRRHAGGRRTLFRPAIGLYAGRNRLGGGLLRWERVAEHPKLLCERYGEARRVR